MVDMARIRRFSVVQIVTHALAALSILLLYLTGLPITFPDQLSWIPSLLGGYEVTMTIHRIAAVGFVTAGVYMVVYHGLFDIFIGRSFLTDVWPRSGDIKDAFNDALHVLKVPLDKTQIPVYGKYSWIAKAEFWSFFSEAVIFLITGFILWFPWQSMTFMPPQYLITARYLHAGFAVISVCGVAFHSYMVHVNPENFQIDRCIFNGYMQEEEVRDRYPLWYEKVKRGEEIAAEKSS
jgi:formate dehydrogenase subunit gamma